MFTKLWPAGIVFTRSRVGQQYQALVSVTPLSIFRFLWGVCVDCGAKESLNPILVLSSEVLWVLGWAPHFDGNPPSPPPTDIIWNISGAIRSVKDVSGGLLFQMCQPLPELWKPPAWPTFYCIQSKESEWRQPKHIYICQTILVMVTHDVIHW